MMKRLLSILLLLSPVVITAQPADSLTRVLNRFNTGAAIQINESRGHFFGLKNSGVVFEGRDSVTNVPLYDIDAVWKQKSHAKGGAITGALVVGIPTALFGMFLVSVTCEDTESHCQHDYPLVAAYGFGLGGAAGGLVGGLIGYTIKKWIRVY